MITSLDELEAIRKECRSMVTNRAFVSAAAAAVPVPGVDIGTDLMLMREILPRITHRFELTPEQIASLDPEARRMVLKVAAGLGNLLIGKAITEKALLAVLQRVGVRVATKSVTKYIPFIGTAIATTASFSAMKWLGNAHIDDCFTVAKQFVASKEKSSFASADKEQPALAA